MSHRFGRITIRLSDDVHLAPNMKHIRVAVARQREQIKVSTKLVDTLGDRFIQMCRNQVVLNVCRFDLKKIWKNNYLMRNRE